MKRIYIFLSLSGLIFQLCSDGAYAKKADDQENKVAPSVYIIDKSHTSVEFEIAHLVISTVKGRFDDLEGIAELDPKTLALRKFMGTVKATSINTNEEKRDKHLRSDEFFDVGKYPEIRLEASNLNIQKGSKSKIKVKLTIKGVTQEIQMDFNYKGLVKDPWGSERAIVEATAMIQRKDFGLTWNKALEAGGVMVGESVKILLTAQAKPKEN